MSSLAYRISGFNRRRKWEQFLKLMRPDATTSVLDVGFSDKEYSPTDNFIEKHYPWPAQITALSVDQPEEFPRRYPQVQAIAYAGREFPFADEQFDVCWSNAVIEHVGDRPRQLLFLREIHRVARAAFITTPNRYFPIEVHTRTPLLHFLPKRWFDAYLRRVGHEWATGDYMHLLSRRGLESLLAEAGISGYQLQANRLGPWALDFVVSWDRRAVQPRSAVERADAEPPAEAALAATTAAD